LIVKYLIGPELFWLLLFLGAMTLGRTNTPPSKEMEDFMGTLWFWIPAASVVLFGL